MGKKESEQTLGTMYKWLTCTWKDAQHPNLSGKQKPKLWWEARTRHCGSWDWKLTMWHTDRCSPREDTRMAGAPVRPGGTPSAIKEMLIKTKKRHHYTTTGVAKIQNLKKKIKIKKKNQRCQMLTRMRRNWVNRTCWGEWMESGTSSQKHRQTVLHAWWGIQPRKITYVCTQGCTR